MAGRMEPRMNDKLTEDAINECFADLEFGKCDAVELLSKGMTIMTFHEKPGSFFMEEEDGGKWLIQLYPSGPTFGYAEAKFDQIREVNRK